MLSRLWHKIVWVVPAWSPVVANLTFFAAFSLSRSRNWRLVAYAWTQISWCHRVIWLWCWDMLSDRLSSLNTGGLSSQASGEQRLIMHYVWTLQICSIYVTHICRDYKHYWCNFVWNHIGYSSDVKSHSHNLHSDPFVIRRRVHFWHDFMHWYFWRRVKKAHL